MNIEQNYGCQPAFQALRVKTIGFEKCPELAESILTKFKENKNVDTFIKEHDVDVTIKKKKDAYTFLMETLNPNRTGAITDIFKKKTLKAKYTGTDIHRSSIGRNLYIDGNYFDEATRSHYKEYGSIYGYGRDGVRPKVWVNVKNINEDIENLINGTKVNERKMARENKRAAKLINNYAGDDTPYWEEFGCSKHEYTQSAGGN